VKRLATAWIACVLSAGAARAEDTGRLEGNVTDPLGDTVKGALVTATGATGAKRTQSDAAGHFALPGLAPGAYAVVVTKPGFSPDAQDAVSLSAGRTTSHDVRLTLAPVRESLTVNSEAPGVSLAPDQNAGALVLEGDALEALPDDPEELAEALQALAGPAAGPNGGQIFVDGFTGGRMPPKSSIREIRINANPFSAEYDRAGFGRIEIFTKPGSDRLRGEASLRFNDDSLNARNPYAPNKPPYQRREWGGNLSGPLASKKASFFLDFERRSVADDRVVNATVLDPQLAPAPFDEAIVAPSLRTTVSPRLDWQISANHTLQARYTYTSTEQENVGVGGYSLPSRAYQSSGRQDTVQLSETAIFGKATSETRARYWSERRSQSGDASVPTLEVQDAFTGGGAQVGEALNEQKRFELHSVTSWALGRHALRAGLNLRTVSERDVAPQGFAGTVVFASGPALASLDRYRLTLQLTRAGLSPAMIVALGAGASQYQINGGNPEADVSQWDLAPFVQDDWRVSPRVLVSAGLRYEVQDNIHSPWNFAPRLGFAWSSGAKGGSGQPQTVVRGGFGVFYDRVSESLTLRARRFDGVRTQRYVLSDPSALAQIAFGPDGEVTSVPSSATLAAFALPQTLWRLDASVAAPYTLQSSLSLERQLAQGFTASATVTASQGRDQLRSRNINAPRADATRPLGEAAGDVDQMESSGRFNQFHLALGLNNRFSEKLTLFFRYFLGRARSDTDGVDTFPADSYDLSTEYGRAAIDVRHRLVLGGSVTGPWEIHFSPLVILASGGPYNITIGRDLNGDGLFTDRPAFASDFAAPGVVSTPYGLFDRAPQPGETLILRNFGDAPSFLMVNLRVSRRISIGRSSAADPPSPQGALPAGAAWRGRFAGGEGRGGGEGGGRGLTLSLSAQNLFNHTNPGAPVGNLSSPLFGQSLASAGGFGFGAGATAGQRRIELQARLSF
jgi:hypothetical protein